MKTTTLFSCSPSLAATRHTVRRRQLQRRLAICSWPMLGLLVAACGEPTPRELGFTQSAQELGTPPDEPVFAPSSDFVGTWVGVAEEPLAMGDDGTIHTYLFPSGSSRIVVELQPSEDGSVTGHITFGAGTPPPAPVDADAGYPAGVGYDALTGYKLSTYGDQNQFAFYAPDAEMLPPFEGFAYSVTPSGALYDRGNGTEVGDGVLSLDYNTNETLAPWCQLQSPHELSLVQGTYSCLPDYGGQFETGSDGTGRMCNLWGPPDTSQCLPDLSNLADCEDPGDPVAQVNCDKVAICSSGYCSCNATSCDAAQTIAHLTVRRIGDELVGVFEDARFKNARGLNTPIGDVHLRRQ